MRRLFIFFLIFISLSVWAENVPTNNNKPLPPNKAFDFSAYAKDSQTIIAHWELAPHYYLYRDRIHFVLKDGDQASLSAPILPVGTFKQSDDLGKYQAYENKVDVTVPIMTHTTNPVTLLVSYQGCSSDGYCYPPITKSVTLNMTKNYGNITCGTTVNEELPKQKARLTAQDYAFNILSSHHLFSILLSFLGFGILLAFTPCVLPMIPILSGIILGAHDERMKTSRAFTLSLTYIISMSLTFAVAGMLVGYIGGSVQSLFQKPWILVLFSLIFVAMALSFFGFYELQMPDSLRNRIAKISNQQKGGTYLGVAIMGVLATLIVSPCVTPALVGALGYISHTGDAMIGGLSLFALGIGMGIPLLFIGTAHGKILPKAGLWMETIKSVFGVMMLGLAIWILDRVLPGPVIIVLWGSLLMISAIFMGAFSTDNHTSWLRICKGFGLIFFIYGTLMIIGAALGNSNPLRPLEGLTINKQQYNMIPFKPVKRVEDVENAISDDAKQQKITMLDFYADWCESCKIMEKHTFADQKVQQLLTQLNILQANVTHNDEDDKELNEYFDVIAPPTILFFDPEGKELEQYRIVGAMDPQQFASLLEMMLHENGSPSSLKGTSETLPDNR